MCPGRSGANFLADEDSIVRTTTSFTLPNQLISPLHTQIMRAVCDSFPEQHDLKFNNILIEEYDDRYRTMSYHSDQSLDLVDSSFIAIYSCYRHQGNQQQHHKNPSRSLFIKDKEARGSAKPIILPLFHNSAVLFSTSTNASYLHLTTNGMSSFVSEERRIQKSISNGPKIFIIQLVQVIYCQLLETARRHHSLHNWLLIVTGIHAKINITIFNKIGCCVFLLILLAQVMEIIF
jgi:hypothetical protein